MIAHYHETKTPISFLCRRGLNPRSLIQPLETSPVKLTGTHKMLGDNLKLVQQNNNYVNLDATLKISY